jgi:hypothetical protein
LKRAANQSRADGICFFSPSALNSLAMSDADKKNKNQAAAPKPKTGCFMKLLGLGLVVLACLMGFYIYEGWKKTGKIPNLLDPEEQKSFGSSTEKLAQQAWTKINYSMEELEKIIGEKPRATKELLEESKQGTVEKIAVKTEATEVAQHVPDTPKPKPVAPDVAEGRRLLQEGLEIYKRTDPGQPQNIVQPLLRQAAAKFEHALDKFEKARAENKISEADYDHHGGKAAEFLYSCRKRMELSR